MVRTFLLPFPDDLEPVGVKCIKLEIPSDPKWQAIFWGYLEGLARWHTWERDDSHTGKIMAEKYDVIIQTARESMTDGECTNLEIRVDPTDSCKLQTSLDGVTWDELIDVTECADTAITNVSNNTSAKAYRISGGVTQYTIDNVTYNNYSDTQYSSFGGPTPAQINDPVGVDKKCLRAKNNVSYMFSTFGDIQKNITVGANVTTVIAGILGVIGALFTGGTSLGLAAAVTALSAQIFNAGNNFFSSLFTTSVIDTLTCDLYNAFGSDGSMTTSAYATLMSLWNSRGTAVWFIVEYWFSCLGPIGMVIAGTQAKGGVSTCSGDPCSRSMYDEFDFTKSPVGAHVSLAVLKFEATVDANRTYSRGTVSSVWIPGKGYSMSMGYSGFTQWSTVSDIRIPIPATMNIRKLEVDVNMGTDASMGGTNVISVNIWNPANSSILARGANRATLGEGLRTFTADFGAVTSVPAGDEIEIFLQVEAANVGAYHQPFGAADIRKLRIFPS